jgi:predicted nucleic-acid-binding protein
MLAIDTNVLVRLLARDDASQAQAADHFVAKGAWVSHLVLAETVWVLESVYQRTAKQLIAALELLLAHEALVLQDADTVSAALAHFRAKPALGFSDCLVLEIARKAGHSPLGTFDKALAKLAGAQKLQ